jgi:hypothetical protein
VAAIGVSNLFLCFRLRPDLSGGGGTGVICDNLCIITDSEVDFKGRTCADPAMFRGFVSDRRFPMKTLDEDAERHPITGLWVNTSDPATVWIINSNSHGD